MKEIEATFYPVDCDKLRQKLINLGAVRIHDRRRFRGQFFHGLHPDKVEWIRVRDEGNQIVMTYKREDADNINSIHEIEIKIDSFENGIKFLEEVGLKNETYSEKDRELWRIDNCDVMIDWWPHIEPLCEIEGLTEKDVNTVVEKLGFDINESWFGGTLKIYRHVYGDKVGGNDVLSNIPELLFDQENPFT